MKFSCSIGQLKDDLGLAYASKTRDCNFMAVILRKKLCL